MVPALKLRGRDGHNALINGIYEPTELKHQERNVWVSRALRPLYIFHTGKSRWVVSKRVDDGSKCYAFITDTGTDPAKAQGGWTCCDEDGNWREDTNVVVIATPASGDKFVQLRMGLDQELERYGLNDPKTLWQLWKRLDCNGNGIASLAEVDKLVVDMVKGKSWPKWLNNKAALMRAFKAADLDTGNRDGWVEISEFHCLLLDIFWFNKLWEIFNVIDTGHDHKLNTEELAKGMGELGLRMSKAEALAEFGHIDTDHDGSIRFTEFCAYAYLRLNPDEDPHQDAAAASSEPSSPRKRRRARSGTVQAPQNSILGKCLEEFNEVEAKIKELMSNQVRLKALWSRLDVNGNDLVSLAELDKLVVETYPVLDHKPALMRAYRATCAGSQKDGEDYVHKKEFKCLLGNVLYFNKIFWLFDHADEERDRRLNYSEFSKLLSIAGAKMSEQDMKAAFAKTDKNGGGHILFDEFCRLFTENHCPECLTGLVD